MSSARWHAKRHLCLRLARTVPPWSPSVKKKIFKLGIPYSRFCNLCAPFAYLYPQFSKLRAWFTNLYPQFCKGKTKRMDCITRGTDSQTELTVYKTESTDCKTESSDFHVYCNIICFHPGWLGGLHMFIIEKMSIFYQWLTVLLVLTRQLIRCFFLIW